MRNRVFILAYVFIFASVIFNLNAQTPFDLKTVNPDARLSEAFDQAFVTKLQKENPALVLYYNFYLDSAYYISILPADKNEFLETLESIDVDNNIETSEINILKYDLKLSFDQRTYYRIGSSDRVMIFYSGQELNDKFNDYRASLGLLNSNVVRNNK